MKGFVAVCIDHLASKWDRSKRSARSDIKRSIASGADVVLLTEMADRDRWKALHGHDGYTVCHDRTPWQAGEVAALVRDGFGKVIHWETRQVGPDLGPGNAVFAIGVVIRLTCGCVISVFDAHLPASVEAAWDSARAQAYRDAVKQYRRFVKEIRRKYRPVAECVWADWNLSLHLAWVRAWVDDEWPRFRVLGKAKTPKRGTHRGGRLIDWPLTWGLRRLKLTILRLTKGSDHRGIRLRGRIRHKH